MPVALLLSKKQGVGHIKIKRYGWLNLIMCGSIGCTQHESHLELQLKLHSQMVSETMLAYHMSYKEMNTALAVGMPIRLST